VQSGLEFADERSKDGDFNRSQKTKGSTLATPTAISRLDHHIAGSVLADVCISRGERSAHKNRRTNHGPPHRL